MNENEQQIEMTSIEEKEQISLLEKYIKEKDLLETQLKLMDEPKKRYDDYIKDYN